MDRNQTTQDILGIVTFLKDNAASKDDLERFATKDDLERFATKDDLSEVKNEIINHLDGFIGLHQKLDIELTALRHKYDRHEKILQKLIRHLQLENS